MLLRTALLSTLLASIASAGLPLLPVPLQIPPGGIEVLPVVKRTSYIGDAVKIVDCPEDKYSPFGTCGNLLFGGMALYDSHLSGLIQVKFYPPVRNISHFEISHPGNLRGDDAVLKAPQVYQFPVQNVYAFDDLAVISSGDLNVATGEVTKVDYRLNVYNTFYTSFASANPKLKAGAFQFPGAYGSANIVFTQRADGKLDLALSASTFLPLNNNVLGDAPRIPMPFCGPQQSCGSIQAPNSSLHPHIHISTVDLDAPLCGANCPAFPANSIQVLTANSAASGAADKFNLNITQLGGNQATAISNMMGKVQFQFGEASGGTLPFVMSVLPASGLLAKPPDSPLAVLGVALGMLGQDSKFSFPSQTYNFESVLMADDPLELCVGAIDLQTGVVSGGMLYRGFFVQTLLEAVLTVNNGAIAPSSFAFRGPAGFERDANGQTVFRFNSGVFLDFANFFWPSPDFTTSHAYVAGPGSELNPLFYLQAAFNPSGPRLLRTGSANNVKAQIGDTFSYSYSVSCDGSGSASFTYTNNSTTKRGGTFTMQNLAAVDCTNSRASTQGPAGSDTLTFSGFGKWSNDSDPHLGSIQVTTYNGQQYVIIQIDGAQLSSADNPQPGVPTP
jgi:hypothetical protein